MSRLIKFVLAGVGLLVLLAVLASAAVYFFVDPEDYRALIIDTVEEQTGRTLKIDGELGLDLFPCCGIAVDGAELGNPEGFSSGYFGRVEEVSIGLRVIPLILQRSVVMGEIRLVGLQLALEEKANGETNWSFETDQADAAGVEQPAEDAAALDSLSVAGVTIRDAAISYKNESDGTDLRVADLNLQTGRIEPGAPFDIEGGFTATDVTSGQALELSLASQATIEEEPVQLALSGMALDIKAAGVTIKLTGEGRVSGDAMGLGGQLEVPTFSPQAVLKDLGEAPIVTADPAVLTKLAASGNWSVDSDRFAIEQLNIKLDDSVISGQLQNNYGGRGDTQFDIAIDEINLDRYTAPEVEGEGSGADAAATEEDLPLDTIRALDLRGTVTAQVATVSDLNLTDVMATVFARDGRVVLKPLAATLYGGKYTGQITLDASGKQATLSLDQAVQGVSAMDLLKDFAETENIEGLMNARVVGTGRGNSATALTDSLKGDVTFDLQDGLYKDMDIWYEIRRARTLLRRKAPAPAPVPAQTKIEALSLKGRIADNVFTSDQIVAEIPFLKLTGSGTLGVVEQNLNYRFRATVDETPVFEDGENLDDLTGLDIPLEIKGSVEDPKISVDLKDLAKDAAVKKAKEKLLDKFFKDDEAAEPADPNAAPKEEDAGDVLKKGLRDLLGN